MSYATQLATEAVVVGGVTVGGFLVVQRLIPDSSLPVQLFATGVAIHLGFEALGFNKWYLKYGAANIL
jgi:hypothetical protein